MQKKAVLSTFMVFFFVCSIIFLQTPALNAQDFFADMFPGLRMVQIEQGQHFTYSIEAKREGEVTAGVLDFLILEIEHGVIEVIIEGEFGEHHISTRAMGWKDNPWEIVNNIGTELENTLPGEMRDMFSATFSMAAIFTAMYGDQFEVGWELKEDEQFEEVILNIPEMKEYGGVEGYLVRMGHGDEVVIEFSVRPDLLLPLMVNFRSLWDDFEDDFAVNDIKYYIELINFSEDGDLSGVVRAEEDAPLLVLAGLVEYFKDQGLEVGERSPRFYDMMGAVAGFGLDIMGEEVELYLFDPETAAPDVLKSLQQVQETGKFDIMGFPMPAVVNGNILMTGLEFGTIYQHPAKEEIVEIFMNYN